MGPRNHVLDRVEISSLVRGNLGGWKASGVCCHVHSKRDHSVVSHVMQQKGSFAPP